jgi:hypothetical protein
VEKRRVILIFVILMIIFCLPRGYCQSISKDIKLTIIHQKREYHNSDTVKFKVQNLSGKNLWFVAGLEVFDEDKWIEVFYDLDHPISGSEKIYRLGQQKRLDLLVKNIPFTGVKSYPYKLFIKYGFNKLLLNKKEEDLHQFVFFK